VASALEGDHTHRRTLPSKCNLREIRTVTLKSYFQHPGKVVTCGGYVTLVLCPKSLAMVSFIPSRSASQVMEYIGAEGEQSSWSNNVVRVTLSLHAVLFLYLKAHRNNQNRACST
jgi:hypothetical protein